MNFWNSLFNNNNNNNKSRSSQSTTTNTTNSSSRRNKSNDNNNNNMSSSFEYNRRAYHSGSWYSSNTRQLDEQLTQFILNASNDLKQREKQQKDTINTTQSPLRACIVPHAGYSYSGPTAGYSYYEIQQELTLRKNNITTILVLHPSHHVALSRCDVSGATTIETPLGNLQVDNELRTEILDMANNKATGTTKTPMSIMSQSVDEHEHSGEMQYPFLYKCINSVGNDNKSRKVLPIMCGNLSTKQEQDYGYLLAPIISRPNVLTVISSDFCHWGSRFAYQPTPPSSSSSPTTTTKKNKISISDFISELDHDGMNQIELQDPGGFAMYLKRTRNTICGRHPIAVYLHAIDYYNNQKNKNSTSGADDAGAAVDIEFIMYDQSSQVRHMNDSSVSYAAAVARLKK